MSTVINRTTREVRRSVHTPDYPPSEWIVNPKLPSCSPEHYVIEGDRVREMTVDEKAELADETTNRLMADRRTAIKAAIGSTDANTTAIMLAFNEVIEELRAIKAGKPKPSRSLAEIKAAMNVAVDPGACDL